MLSISVAKESESFFLKSNLENANVTNTSAQLETLNPG